jgi:protein-disulfide isomerase
MSSPSGTDPDLTRKERREQARSERKAIEAAAAAQDARRKRMIQLGAAIGAVVVIIAVILVATSGGGGKPGGLAKGKQANQTVASVNSLLNGIPQSGNVLGKPDAPVTMQYFGDLECPVCKQFTLGALPPLIEKYVRTGQLKIEYRSLETATREPETFKTQQIAALAAGKQHLGWNYIELFYHEQGQEDSGYVTESYLQSLAQQLPGLNLPDWSAARNDAALTEQITADGQAAAQNNLTGTPSFMIGKTGGSLSKFEYSSLEDPASFEKAISKLLT